MKIEKKTKQERKFIIVLFMLAILLDEKQCTNLNDHFLINIAVISVNYI